MSNDPIRILVVGCALLALAGCSSSSDSGEGQNPNPTRVGFPLEGAVYDIQVQAGVPRQYMFTLQMPPEMKIVTRAEIDVAGTLAYGDLTGVADISLLARALSSQFGIAGGPVASAYMS